MKSVKRFGILLIGFSFLIFCKGREGTPETSLGDSSEEQAAEGIHVNKEQFVSRGMSLGALDTITIREWVGTQGYIDVPPENRAVVSAPMPGFVSKAPFIVGDRVTKGQVLLTLENPEFVSLQQAYLEALAQQEFLKSEFERQKTLYAEQVTSRKKYLKAESDYRKNEAEVMSLKAQLELLHVNVSGVESDGIRSHLNLYAPLGGSITTVMVSRGMYASPNQALLEVVDTGHLHLELGVYESEVPRIRIGQEIRFYLPEDPDIVFKGEVYKVGKLVEKESRTVLIHGHMSDVQEDSFPLGAYIQAEITVSEKQVVALPEESLLREGEETYVLAVSELPDGDYRLRKVAVNTGAVQEGYVQIELPEEEPGKKKFLTRGAFWFKAAGE